MDIYLYRTDVYTGSTPPNVTNWDVESIDGERLGKIDDATYEDSNGMASGCLVVDTGFWIFGKKRLVPAGVVTGLDREREKVLVSLTKDELKDAPDYRAEQHAADERGYHDEERNYYDRFGGSTSN